MPNQSQMCAKAISILDSRYLVLRVLDGILADELELDKLQQLFCVRDTLKHGTQVEQCLLVVDGGERSKSVALACRVVLGFEECGNEL